MTVPAPGPRPIRATPVPCTRPPVLADDGPPTPEELAPSPYIQDALAVDLAVGSDEQVFGFQPTRRSELPEPHEWAAHVAQALVEVMAGARPAPQLLRHTTTEVYAVVSRRHALAARRAPQRTARAARVRRVVVCEPCDGVAEVSVVVLDGPRVRALALRMVGLDGRWRVEALQVG